MSKFCVKPFDNFEVDTNGDVRVCCGMWLPDIIGNINEEDIQDIFDSDKARKLRRSIIDGSFKYCNHQLCPHLVNNDLPEKKDMVGGRYKTEEASFPVFFNFCNDASCNLSCPSCRISKHNLLKGKIYKQKKITNDKIIEYVLKNAKENPNYNIYLHITGSGDPFASRIYREFLFGFDGRKTPNIKINLQTNGVMFSHVYWKRMYKCQENICSVQVSFDAATSDTYSITRRDGDWDSLLQNYAFLSALRINNKISSLRADFVVQDYNYREMPDFAESVFYIGQGTDNIVFQKIVNWGTYSEEEFKERDICNIEHPEHDDFLEILRDDRLREPRICWGNVAPYYNKAHTK
jgi:MoaA/NifB/PqqE/SkfB family radical SAM enzyme